MSTQRYPSPAKVAAPKSWTRVFPGPERITARDALPPHQWVTATEFFQTNGSLDVMEKHGITQALWEKWCDLHYKLVDNADKYLVDKPNVDTNLASDTWQRWNYEADEHVTYHSFMMWRFQCFTEANIELIPPGELREEIRFTAPNDLHPDVQEEIWAHRQAWLPPKYKADFLPDPMRISRRSNAARAELLKKIDAFQAEWAAKATRDIESECVTTYCNTWRKIVAPTGHITAAGIAKETDVALLHEWFDEVFADNGDDRLYLIATRAAQLRKDDRAEKMAAWCAGMVARDSDAGVRSVDGAQPAKAAPLSKEEEAGAHLPADFCEIKTKEQAEAFIAFYDAHWKRVAPVYSPSDAALYSTAWAEFKTSAYGVTDGAELRRIWWRALNHAYASVKDKGGLYYGPPLMRATRNAGGTKFLLRMYAALAKEGAFDAIKALDPDYYVDTLCFIDVSKLSAADIESVNKEYPGLGIDWSTVTAGGKSRLEAAGLKPSLIGA